jgi:hypothetical protein
VLRRLTERSQSAMLIEAKLSPCHARNLRSATGRDNPYRVASAILRGPQLPARVDASCSKAESRDRSKTVRNLFQPSEAEIDERVHLGYQEDVFPRHSRVLDSLADFVLVPINQGSIDMPIEGVADTIKFKKDQEQASRSECLCSPVTRA